jgi:hypothetical protein
MEQLEAQSMVIMETSNNMETKELWIKLRRRFLVPEQEQDMEQEPDMAEPEALSMVINSMERKG